MNRFFKLSMLLLLTSSLMVITSGCFPNNQSKHINQPQKSSVPNKTKLQSNNSKISDIESYINEIKKDAKKGQTPNATFTIGKADIKEIEQKWGKPNKLSSTKVGLYATYDKKKITFGYYSHSTIFDIRSYSSDLKKIKLKDIKKTMGSPTKVLSYDDKNIHQQILVYSLSDEKELKWIVSKPTRENPNPSVDHISVYNSEIAERSLPAKLNKMSLDEKIGQMLLIGINGIAPDSDTKEMIEHEHIGGVILYGNNIKSPNQTINFTNQLRMINQSSKSPLPLFISVDEEGGNVDRMPSPILKMPSNLAVGEKDDSDFSYNVGKTLGEEVNALGFNMDYAPVLDVIKNPSTAAIGDRSFGVNANLVSRLGVSTMKGIGSQHVIPVIKHFPGYGSVSVDAHKELPTVDYGLSQLENNDWLPYKNAIKNNADVIMVTHLLVPKLNTKYPASMSPIIMTDMLRDKLGFKGVIMTDDMTMGAIAKHYNIQTAAVKAVEAGADVVMISFHKNVQIDAFKGLKQAVLDGTISKQRIDNSVYRIMKLKQKYNLSNKQIGYPNISSINSDIKKVLVGLK